MRKISLQCPSCGGSIEIDRKSSLAKCHFCETAYDVRDDVILGVLSIEGVLLKRGLILKIPSYMDNGFITSYRDCLQNIARERINLTSEQKEVVNDFIEDSRIAISNYIDKHSRSFDIHDLIVTADLLESLSKTDLGFRDLPRLIAKLRSESNSILASRKRRRIIKTVLISLAVIIPVSSIAIPTSISSYNHSRNRLEITWTNKSGTKNGNYLDINLFGSVRNNSSKGLDYLYVSSNVTRNGEFIANLTMNITNMYQTGKTSKSYKIEFTNIYVGSDSDPIMDFYRLPLDNFKFDNEIKTVCWNDGTNKYYQ